MKGYKIFSPLFSFITLTASVILIISLTSCVKKKESRKVLNAVLHAEISTLDPGIAFDAVSLKIISQCYETLYQYHYLKRPYSIEPSLATKMPRIEDGGKKFIIRIKPGIQYHENPAFDNKTRFLKAQDFITSIKRVAFKPTKSNGWFLYDGLIKGLNNFRERAGDSFAKFKALEVEGLKALSDHTLMIELVRPNPQMLYLLSLNFSSPIPIEAVEYYKNDLDNDAISVGTGPFRMNKQAKSKDVTLVRFKHYRKETYPTQGDRFSRDNDLLKDANKQIPFLDEIHFIIESDTRKKWNLFKLKHIDYLQLNRNIVTSDIWQKEIGKERAKKYFQESTSTTLSFTWLQFNMNDSVVGNNPYLRKAIAHGIDRKRYIDLVGANTQKANSLYPPGIPGYNPSHELPFEFDLDRAKQYLEKAGYTKENLPLKLRFDTRASSPGDIQRAEFIKDELKKLGIETEIVVNSFPEFLEKKKMGSLQFWTGGWVMDYPDAENILQLLISKNRPPGPNASAYSNSKFDSLFDKLKVLPDGPRKFKLMAQMEMIVHSDLPWIMLYFHRKHILHQNHLKNYRFSGLIYNNFKYLRVSK